MRDSITYNLKYFIMKMSGTKPMKNTMRKSPINQGMLGAAVNPAITAVKKVTELAKAKKETASAGPRPKAPTKTTKATTPATQLKKHKR